MDIKIANIINLFQKRNFNEAKLKCIEIQNLYENNPEIYTKTYKTYANTHKSI